MLVVLDQKNWTYPSSSSYVTYVTVGVNCLICHKKNRNCSNHGTQGVCAECTVSLHFLHPKDKIAEKIPNQTEAQKLSVLVVQERVEKPIRCKATQCVMFRHKDFGGQLLWCMEKYIKVDVGGPKETFFDAIHVESTQGQEQAMQSNNNVVEVKRKPSNFLKQFWMSSRIHTWMWMTSKLLEMRLRWLMMTTCPLLRTFLNKTLTTTIKTTISCRVGSIVGSAHVVQPSEQMQPLC